MPFSSDYFVTRKRIRTDWIIPNWLPRGNTAFIIGPPKRAHKSWLTLAMCWDLSEGKPVWSLGRFPHGIDRGKEYLFTPPRPMRCVYFTQEDTEDNIHDRMDICFKAGRKPNDNLWLIPKNLNLVIDDPKGRNAMRDELDIVAKTGPIDLVCFDPMRRMHRGNENDSQVIGNIWAFCDGVHRRYSCATLFVHHVVKPREGVDPTSPFASRGSGDIYGGGDAFINVIPQRKKGSHAYGRAELHFESKRAAPIEPMMVEVDVSTGAVRQIKGEEKPGFSHKGGRGGNPDSDGVDLSEL